MPSKIMIIRHGEKPDSGVRGVTEDGSHDPNELGVRGWQRSGALVRLFAPRNGQFAHAGLAKPDAIFAEGATKHTQSLRAQHTVLALSQVLGKKLNVKYSKNDEKELVKDVLGTEGVVLIAWEHNAILDIANRIAGNDKTTPQHWPDSRFDVVWVFDKQGSEWKFSQIPQMVLPGDEDKPI